MQALKIIKEELARIYSSKTIDALIPPIVFVIAQNFLTLKLATIFATAFASIIALYRIIKKQKSIYAILGILTVGLAAGYAFYTNNAKSYFLPKIISTGFLALLSIISVLIKKPLAAFLSHFSRGWPLKWFWRKDIRPAYSEVTIAWFVMFVIRFVILFNLFQSGEVSDLLIINLILGTPATILVLIFTYFYGVKRLKSLKGPSVDEYLNNSKPPYKGQSRGF